MIQPIITELRLDVTLDQTFPWFTLHYPSKRPMGNLSTSLSLDLSDYNVKRGAYGIVLVDSAKNAAYKLFKSYAHPDYIGEGNEEIGEIAFNQWKRDTFENEVSAYNKVQGVRLLESHTPTFRGKCSVNSITHNGIDCSSHYLLDCCYLIDFVQGREMKLHDYLQHKEELELFEMQFGYNFAAVLSEFESRSINYLEDSSIIVEDNSAKVIDFAEIDPKTFTPVVSW